MADMRTGLYGLNSDDLEVAGSLGLSPWEFSEQFKGNGPLKPLTDAQKREEWKRLFAERISEQADKLKIWMDGDGILWLGWFRRQGGQEVIIIVAKLQPKTQTVVAVPMRRELTDALEGVAWWRPWMAQGTWEKIKSWRQIVPPGVF